MLKDNKSSFLELIDQCNRSIDINEIIIGKFFSVQFIENGFQVSVENTFLMWIFSITERAGFLLTILKNRQGLFPVKIIEYGRIIM